MDRNYKEAKPGGSANKDQNKASNESDGSSGSDKQIKLKHDPAPQDNETKTKSVLPGSKCSKKRLHAQNNNQVKVVNTSNLNGFANLRQVKNEEVQEPSLNQLFTNTDIINEAKGDKNLPAVQESPNKKIFSL